MSGEIFYLLIKMTIMSRLQSIYSRKISEKVPSNPFYFLFYVLILSWFFWILASQVSDFSVLFHYIGGAIPFLMTLLFLFVQNTNAERHDFLLRVIDLKRISGHIWLLIIFIVPAGFFISGSLDWLLFGKTPILDHWINISAKPLGLLLFAFFILIFGPVPEEITWRGFVLDKLQNRYPWLIANLLLGTFWMFWHLPLFLIPGSYQHSLGILTPWFWLFLAALIPQTILMGWVYNQAHRSTLSAIIIHFLVNLLGELVDFSLSGEILLTAYWWIVAIVIIIYSFKTDKPINPLLESTSLHLEQPGKEE